MGFIGDLWDKITGKPKEPAPITHQQKNEQIAMARFTRDQQTWAGTSPEIRNFRNQQEQTLESQKQHAREYANEIEKPGPAERILTKQSLEPARHETEEKREVKRAGAQEIAAGTRSPMKSFEQLHPQLPKDRGHDR